MEDSGDEKIYLECIQVGKRLRVRILDARYSTAANCQFPRAIRSKGRLYSVPPRAIQVICTRSSKYYWINPKLITIEGDDSTKIDIKKIYTDDATEDCVICMDNKKYYVFGPCGHFYICKECKDANMNKCPICRCNILSYIPYSEMK